MKVNSSDNCKFYDKDKNCIACQDNYGLHNLNCRECSENEEFYNGICVNKCTDNEFRSNDDGICYNKYKYCHDININNNLIQLTNHIYN